MISIHCARPETVHTRRNRTPLIRRKILRNLEFALIGTPTMHQFSGGSYRVHRNRTSVGVAFAVSCHALTVFWWAIKRKQRSEAFRCDATRPTRQYSESKTTSGSMPTHPQHSAPERRNVSKAHCSHIRTFAARGGKVAALGVARTTGGKSPSMLSTDRFCMRGSEPICEGMKHTNARADSLWNIITCNSQA